MEVLSDPELSSAISNIIQRSERQPDVEVLERTFVDLGVIPQLQNRNGQILYGRRGTGKSHVLRVLGAHVERAPESTHAYIDVRLLGSAQMITDPSRPVALRAITVFRDMVRLIHDRLLEHATDPEVKSPGSALETLATLGEAIRRSVRDVSERTVRRRGSQATATSAQVGGSIGLQGASLNAGGSNRTESTSELEEQFIESLRDTVVFSDVARALDETLVALGLDLLVLIDEWTAIPIDVQPFVADLVKRTLLPSQRLTLKIASLEYRSRFSMPLERNNLIGFEVGSDIAANIDLDDYYVYERTPDRVVDAFLELLYRHVVAELPDEYLEKLSIKTAVAFRTSLFTEPATFVEAVRAGEGVVRDFLGIVGSAFFRAERSGKAKIDINSVEEAARSWYETDKATNLSEDQHQVLHRIIGEVIGDRQARSFLLERSVASSHPMIQSLLDLRLLHLMMRGYSDKQNPGLRYNIYTLDYGTYVDLKRTRSQPEIELVEVEEESADRLVPFDDKRSIRRIILSPEILDASVEEKPN